MGNKLEIKMNTAVTVSNEKRRVGRPKGDPSTKLAQCKSLYTTLLAEGKDRTAIVAAFEALGVSKGTAQVYYHDAKKKSGNAGGTV